MQTKNVISKLESMLPFASAKEKQLGKYILEHRQEVLSLPLKELSLQTGVSEATIIRFVRKLECDGYADFKLALSADLNKQEYSDLILENIEVTDSPDTIMKKISAFVITSIQSTAEYVDAEQLKMAVQLIRKTHRDNHRIYLNGLGASSTLVRQLQIKLMRLNIPVTYFEDIHLQLESNLSMGEDDLLICFTTLGKSTQTHQFIDIANQKKTKVILVTQFGNQELANKATVTLFASAVENNLRLASSAALIVQSVIIDTLFFALALEEFAEINDRVAEKNKIFAELSYTMNL